MKRRVLTGFLILLVAAVVSGCGESKVDEMATTGVAPDITPPSVLSTNPTGSNVPVNTNISVGFNEAVFNVDSFSFTVVPTIMGSPGSPVAGVFSTSGSTWSFDPSADLEYNTTYTVTITTAITDMMGNPLAAGTSWSFTTGAAADNIAPTVVTTSPSGTNVPANTAVSATFSEQINCSTITSASFNVAGGGGMVNGSLSCSTGWDVTFTPTAPLSNNTVYTATLTTAVTDLAGNPLAASKVWTFTTVPSGSITTASLPAATEGGSYSKQLTASGGTAPLSWSASGLPTSLSCNASGLISGTVDAGTASGSPYSVNITLTDAASMVTTTTLSLTVNPAPTVTSPGGSAFSGTDGKTIAPISLSAIGGTGTLTWHSTGLPPGLSFTSATGASSSIAGTIGAGAAGTGGQTDYIAGIWVTDSNLASGPTTTVTISVVAGVTGVTATAGVTDVAVSWSETWSSATAYRVYYSTSPTVTKMDSSVPGAGSPISVTGLASGTPYYFAVSVEYGTIASDLSSVATATAP